VIYSQRDNCSNLENQLKLVKQTTIENLAEETNLVKQTSQTAFNTHNSWLAARSYKMYGQHSVRPPAREPSTYGTRVNSTTYQYSVPIANRYTTLSNCKEPHPTCGMIPPSNNKHPLRCMAAKNRKYTTRSPKEEKIKTNQRRSSRTILSNIHNPQERRENDGEIIFEL